MPTKKLFETAHANGVAQYLITGSGEIFLKATGGSNADENGDGSAGSTQHLTGDVGDGQTISITKLHWSGGVTITETEGVSFTLSGNGAWSQFNGWTPVDVTGTLTIANTEATGTLFIEVKKGKGYN